MDLLAITLVHPVIDASNLRKMSRDDLLAHARKLLQEGFKVTPWQIGEVQIVDKASSDDPRIYYTRGDLIVNSLRDIPLATEADDARPRFVVAEHWELLDNHGAKWCRWVYDRKTKAIISSSFQKGSGAWCDTLHCTLCDQLRINLFSNIFYGNNEIIHDPQQYGAIETDTLPIWAREVVPLCQTTP
jgi:hypothetical protein